MKHLKNLFGALMLLVTAFILSGCGNGDNALEEIINGGGGSSNSTESSVPKYREWNGTTFVEKEIPEDAIPITSATYGLNSDKMYVVNSDVTISGILDIDNINSNVKIILCDDATLTINGQIASPTDAEAPNPPVCSLTIYSQKNGTGKIVVNLDVANYNAIYARNLTIHGGEIEAKATGNSSMGIFVYKDIYVYGGKITAEGTKRAIMIDNGSGGKFYMIDGEVVATGTSYTEGGGAIRGGWGINGKIEMSGGSLIANGGASGPYDATVGCVGGCGINGDITISGGTLKANGGKGGDGTTTRGGGGNGASANLYYSGGSVIAIGGEHGDGGGDKGHGSGISNGIKNNTTSPLDYDLTDLPVSWPSVANYTLAAGSTQSLALISPKSAARVPHE